jgi:hypothetical protein
LYLKNELILKNENNQLKSNLSKIQQEHNSFQSEKLKCHEKENQFIEQINNLNQKVFYYYCMLYLFAICL